MKARWGIKEAKMVTKFNLTCIVSIVISLVFVGISDAGINPETCVGAWLFDDSKGDTAKDISESGNDGKLTNEPKWVDGQFGGALEFDGRVNGVRDHVLCGRDASINSIADAITITAWVYPMAESNYEYIVSNDRDCCGQYKGYSLSLGYTGFQVQDGEIGNFSSMVCNYSWGLTGGHSHTLALFRLFAGAPAEWVFGHMDSDKAAAGDGDLRGTGMILYENGIRGFLNTGGWLNIDFVGSDGWISARNEHADFEMWSRHPVTREPIRRQFPNPKRPRSSQQAAIEALVKNIAEGTEPLCPGEYGREALEIAIGLRESHRGGGEKIKLPLDDRSLKLG